MTHDQQAGERLPLPIGREYIDEEALARWRSTDGKHGHDFAANNNTVWRLVATIDHYRAALEATRTADARVEELRKGVDLIRANASGREPVPVNAGTKEGIRQIALALSARLGEIERTARTLLNGVTNG